MFHNLIIFHCLLFLPRALLFAVPLFPHFSSPKSVDSGLLFFLSFFLKATSFFKKKRKKLFLVSSTSSQEIMLKCTRKCHTLSHKSPMWFTRRKLWHEEVSSLHCRHDWHRLRAPPETPPYPNCHRCKPIRKNRERRRKLIRLMPNRKKPKKRCIESQEDKKQKKNNNNSTIEEKRWDGKRKKE